MTAVVTGMGAVSSVGTEVDSMFEALCAGRTGLHPLRAFDRSRYKAQHAYEIDDRPSAGTDVPLRATRWLLQAVTEAAQSAGLGNDLRGIPVIIGTTLRELRSVELSWRDHVEFDMRDLHFGPAMRRAFATTDTFTVANACAASLYALAMGCDLLALGEAPTVIVAGVDALTESTYGLLDRCYADPPVSVRPFDRARRGMLQGEGAVAVVLSREGVGLTALARIRGVAINCDAQHPSAPDAASIERAIRLAHECAAVRSADIDLVMLHGTGTALNDEAEAAAVSAVFESPGPHLTALKSMIGHTAGASGLHSLVAAVCALRSGRVPPTIGVDDPIDEVSRWRLVRDRAVAVHLDMAQVDSFGFGGLNAVAVVEKVP